MFALVLRTNGEYNICEVGRIHKRKKNNTCTVRLDDHPPCRARLLACNESCEMLMEIEKLLNTGSPTVRINTLSNDTIVTENSSILDCSISSSGFSMDRMPSNATTKLLPPSQTKISNSPATPLLDPLKTSSIDQGDDDNNNCNRQRNFVDNIQNKGVGIHDNLCTSSPQTDDSITSAVRQKTSNDYNQILWNGNEPNICASPFHLDNDIPYTTSVLPQNILSLFDESDTTTIGNSEAVNLNFSGIDYVPDENTDIWVEYDENREIDQGLEELNRNSDRVDTVEECVEERRNEATFVEDRDVHSEVIGFEEHTGEHKIVSKGMIDTQEVDNAEHLVETRDMYAEVGDREQLHDTVRKVNVESVKCSKEYVNAPDRRAEGITIRENLRQNVGECIIRQNIGATNIDIRTQFSKDQGTIATTEDVSRDSTDSQHLEKPYSAHNIRSNNVCGMDRSVAGNRLLYNTFDSIIAQTDNDSDYEPSDHESSTDDYDGDARDSGIKHRNSGHKGKRSQNTSTESNRLSLSFTANVPGASACDDSKLTVDRSHVKGDKKYNYCVFCHKIQTKIARHLIKVHNNEPEIQKCISLPKNSPLRRIEIGILRKQGNFLFNTNPELNTGSRIVVRRPNKKYDRNGADYAHCAKCKGSYSKNTLRIHFAKCTGVSSKKNRLVMLSAKQVAGMVHPSASAIVRNRIIPVLRDDNVARAVRYDELLMTYINKQCKKYRSEHYDKMIRQRLRMMGRFLLAARTFNENVTDFACIFDPAVYDDCISAVNSVAGLDETTNAYRSPSTASMIGTLIKQIGKMHISDCIKRKRNDKMKDAEDFLKLLDEDYTVSVNSTVAENQADQRRQKVIQIPSMDDIQKLHDYLSKERKRGLESLKMNFTLESWRDLTETLLTSVQLFNRRRAGEVERMKISDFERYRGIDKDVDKDLWKQLSETARDAARKYVRFEIRGKKRRPVPVLLSSEMLECLKVVPEHRRKAKVLCTNPYVFGMPTNNRTTIHKHLDACLLMRKFSGVCDANNPESLRGTELRKHMATKCLALNLNDQDVGEVANLGHSTDIHKQVYRQTIVSREIMKMSKLLEKAQGDESESDGEDTGDEGDDESPSNGEGTSGHIMENRGFANLQNAHEFDEEAGVGSGREGPAESSPDTNVTIVRKKKEPRRSNEGNKRRYTKMTKDTTTRPAKKRRSSSPHGSVKRVAWIVPEKNILLQEYGASIGSDSKKFPSLKSIADFISKNAILQTRTP